MCNIYLPGSRALNQQQLTDIYNQLLQPFIIRVDFNAHNLWSSNHTLKGPAGKGFSGTARHQYYEQLSTHQDIRRHRIINRHDIVLTATGGRSSFDCFQFNRGQWPLPDTYNVQRGDWDKRTNKLEHTKSELRHTRTSDAWLQMPQLHLSNNDLIEGLYDRIRTAANEAIPPTAHSKFYPRPWWGPELQQSKERRESSISNID